ncbi:MAG: hypothetical protein ABL919_12420 [Methylococcales bacterium]|nr:hypothetical protein [Methylococcaceae bacterium]
MVDFNKYSVQKIKVDGKDAADGNHPIAHSLANVTLIFYGHSADSIISFLKTKGGETIRSPHEDGIVVWGCYEKTVLIGKTETFDSLNLRHNGWAEGVLKMASPGTVEIIPGLDAMDILGNPLMAALSAKRYFVALCRKDHGGKFVHGQTFSAVLGLIPQGNPGKQLGEIAKEVERFRRK